jgi:hypothetical protein
MPSAPCAAYPARISIALEPAAAIEAFLGIYNGANVQILPRMMETLPCISMPS